MTTNSNTLINRLAGRYREAIVAAAVSTIAGTVFDRVLPGLMTSLRQQLTSSIMLSGDTSHTNGSHYRNAMRILSKTGALSRLGTRTMMYGHTMTAAAGGEQSLPDSGLTFFRYAGCWFMVELFPQDKGTATPATIVISSFGKLSGAMKELIAEISHEEPSRDATTMEVAVFGNRIGHSTIHHVALRPASSIILPAEQREELFGLVKSWIDDEDLYVSEHFPHKLTLILQGESGTGKTSIARALATEFNLPIRAMNLANVGDDEICNLFRSLTGRSLVLLEDADSDKTLRNRKTGGQRTQEMRPAELPESTAVRSLSGTLNTLDGIVPLHGVLTIITTNTLEDFDDAVLRAGRVDEIFHIKPLTDVDIREYLSEKFPNAKLPKEPFPDIKGCDLRRYYRRHIKDIEKFILALSTHCPKNT